MEREGGVEMRSDVEENSKVPSGRGLFLRGGAL
jgi:hypothetical protein